MYAKTKRELQASDYHLEIPGYRRRAVELEDQRLVPSPPVQYGCGAPDAYRADKEQRRANFIRGGVTKGLISHLVGKTVGPLPP